MSDSSEHGSSAAAAGKSREEWLDYAIDLQRIIEDLCQNRSFIRVPNTTARHHYNMAVEYLRSRLQPAAASEGASPEAVNQSRNEVIEMCAAKADQEEELDGDMPDEFHLIPVEDVARAAVRATKKNIASSIRSLKDHSNE